MDGDRDFSSGCFNVDEDETDFDFVCDQDLDGKRDFSSECFDVDEDETEFDFVCDEDLDDDRDFSSECFDVDEDEMGFDFVCDENLVVGTFLLNCLMFKWMRMSSVIRTGMTGIVKAQMIMRQRKSLFS